MGNPPIKTPGGLKNRNRAARAALGVSDDNPGRNAAALVFQHSSGDELEFRPGQSVPPPRPPGHPSARPGRLTPPPGTPLALPKDLKPPQPGVLASPPVLAT
ncbi:unnamed protein product [Nesidiocoris tenuis]|uniref:Uncharacterized protein n=1 Tax=Nesidiocoris tenuis TaxID=355587 RepID=A0A6H5G6W0_9HEMI|nr:unnamed protein product [Nesidiocoris tenuis]CAA9998503.1 unnamed protein product [Nesidiocoris tenuis]CAB0004016.1 unnamed protein product [Nesidiocoris tenuis]